VVDGRYGSNVLLGGLLLRVLATHDMYRSEMTQQRFAEPKATSWPCRALAMQGGSIPVEHEWRALAPTCTTQLYVQCGAAPTVQGLRQRRFVASKAMRYAHGSRNRFVALGFLTPTPAPPMSQQKSEVCPKGVLAAVGDVQETCMHPVACVSYICHAESMHCTALLTSCMSKISTDEGTVWCKCRHTVLILVILVYVGHKRSCTKHKKH
jgi:hypothetical protein